MTVPPVTGEQAPDFALKDQHGRTVRLSDYRGHKAVVLVFYPWSFTGVCTGEMCAIRDELPTFQNDDVQVLAVSCDSMFTQRVFAEREGLQYPVLSDFWPHGEVARSYRVFDEQAGAAIRGTFVIDRDGIVRWHVLNAIPDARDVGDYRSILAQIAA